jgi:hypothetical protein
MRFPIGSVAVSTAMLALLLASQAPAADFHVSTSGDDDVGNGSAGAPWRTIQHAVNAGIPADGGHTVIVADGVYDGSTLVTRGFPNPVVVRAEHALRAKLTNVSGDREAIRVYLDGPVRLTFSGFVISNAHPSYTCPSGREDYYLIHLQDASDVTIRDNVIFGNNAPGRCNELLKINRSLDTVYVRNVVVRGNVFYDPANAGGADMIDSVRPGEVRIFENIFFGTPDHDLSQSFITLKRQAPDDQPSSPRYEVSRNVFMHWGGKSDQAFVQFGEDGVDFHEITDALVENNLVIGDSPASLAAPFQFKGAKGVRVRANTIVGDLPGGSFGFRVGTEGDNPPMSDFDIRNNIWADPTGTMTNRLVNTYGDVDVATITLDNNLYWNSGQLLPTSGAVTPAHDAHAVQGDPLLTGDHAAIVLPRWDESAGAFPSGTTTIREEFLRLVETYGALALGSAAVDAADPTHMPADDIRGFARDGTPDIGAYELGASTSGTGGTAGAGGTAGSTGSGGSSGVGGSSGMGGTGGAPGSGGAGVSGSGGGSAGSSPTMPEKSDEDSGCACRTSRPSLPSWWLPTLGALLASVGFARGRRASGSDS